MTASTAEYSLKSASEAVSVSVFVSGGSSGHYTTH